MTLNTLAPMFAAGLVAMTLAACSPGGGGALSAGLTQRMDQPGASLNTAEAIGIINHFRGASGVAPVTEDMGLNGSAQALATAYAKTGTTPKLPATLVVIRTSAGYADFAETFSGWRNSPADAAGLTERSATKAGIGVAFDPSSTYGVYWVLLLDD